jgi:aminoglycoside/choline kinase family phosphotransferase
MHGFFHKHGLPHMSTDAILASTRTHLNIDPSVSVTMTPIKKGASGRTVVRIMSTGRDPFIGIHWKPERPDSDNFVPVARFLKKCKLRVPEVYYENRNKRVALVQDLGDVDLLSLKDAPFAERLPYYRSALTQIDQLFYARPPKDLELMPPFDENLYRWEQEYFMDHLVGDYLGMDSAPLRQSAELIKLAQGLGASAKHLVHRDFQSQNILLFEGEAWLIDFQGLRRGRQEYDLASLFYDPYMNHSDDDRERLLDLWEEISEDRPAVTTLRDCAIQRLMQALGAYGNLVENQQQDWYQQHIPTAAAMLHGLVKETALEALLVPYLRQAMRQK